MEIFNGLVIYSHSLTEEQVFQHFQRWVKWEQTSLLRENRVIALYVFDGRSGDLAHLKAPVRERFTLPKLSSQGFSMS